LPGEGELREKPIAERKKASGQPLAFLRPPPPPASHVYRFPRHPEEKDLILVNFFSEIADESEKHLHKG